MKFLIITLAVIGIVAADVSHIVGQNGYNYEHSGAEHHEHHEHHNDLNVHHEHHGHNDEAVHHEHNDHNDQHHENHHHAEAAASIQESSQYLPPHEEHVSGSFNDEIVEPIQPISEIIAPASEKLSSPPFILPPAPVEEIGSNQEYLPPVQPTVEDIAATATGAVENQAEPEPAHVLLDDGYHYKSVKRYRYRYKY